MTRSRDSQRPALPNQPAFGGGVAETILHPAVLVAMLLTGLLMLVLQRRYVIIPFLLTTILVPGGQQLYFAGVHWYVLRLVILAGCLRLAKARFEVPGGLNAIDKLFILWALSRAIAVMLLYQEGGAVVNQIAFWLESFGGYFLLRYLIRDVDDIVLTAKVLAIIAAVVGLCMLNEHFHSINVFGYLHSSPLIPQVRDGQIRAEGPFRHPILAGCFGATLLPLFFWLWKSGRAKGIAAAGIIGSTAIVLTSASSTPVLAYAGGVLGLCLWPIRRSMRVVRWGIVVAIAGLALLMKAPVWFIIAHVNVIGGSGGWDRAKLIDVFVTHFQDWWLLGTKDAGTWGIDMWDLSNQFVAEGETGGLLTFALFIAMISQGFSRLGRMRRLVEGDREQEWLIWSLCAVMLANIFSYFGVSYWDQTRVSWWAFLAMIPAATMGLQAANTQTMEIASEYGAVVEEETDAQLWDVDGQSTERPTEQLAPLFPPHKW